MQQLQALKELAENLLTVDPNKGKLFWEERPRDMFPSEWSWKVWNINNSGKEAFTAINSDGYKHGTIFGKSYKAHRIIWILCNDDNLKHIDHINHDPSDNRLVNLRSVAPNKNWKNRSKNSDNKSGFNGVSWHKAIGKWVAYISHEGKKIHLGSYRDIDAAIAARQVANIKHGYHMNHGKDV